MRPKTHFVHTIPIAVNEKSQNSHRAWILGFIGLLLLMSIALLNCRRESPRAASPPMEKAPSVISYLDRPAEPRSKIIFREDLRIQHEGWWPNKVFIDVQGRILVSTYRENKIFIHDSNGREIRTMEFAKGEGPGDFSSMEPEFSANGNLYVYDRLQQRLTIMDIQGGPVKAVMKFGEMRWTFALGSHADFYFWVIKRQEGSGDTPSIVLSRFDEKGKLVKEYISYSYAAGGTDRSGKRLYNLFSPYGIFKMDKAGNLYIATSNKYEISVYSPEGLPLRRIINGTAPRKPTKEDVETILPFYSEFPKEQTILVPPQQMPAIADLLILPDSSLLVITFDPSNSSGLLAADWYSPEGRFLNRVQLPKYYLWFKVFGPDISHAVFEGDSFYDIESGDEKSDVFWVKRYKFQKVN
jgi:hypothetical protein